METRRIEDTKTRMAPNARLLNPVETGVRHRTTIPGIIRQTAGRSSAPLDLSFETCVSHRPSDPGRESIPRAHPRPAARPRPALRSLDSTPHPDASSVPMATKLRPVGPRSHPSTPVHTRCRSVDTTSRDNLYRAAFASWHPGGLIRQSGGQSIDCAARPLDDSRSILMFGSSWIEERGRWGRWARTKLLRRAHLSRNMGTQAAP